MSKKCYAVITLLILIVAVDVFRIFFQPAEQESPDGRMTIHLNADERDAVLAEMRAFLTSVQLITQGAAENDMELVAEFARKSGKAAQAEMPATLHEKLPEKFRQLGFATHTKFDQLAMDALDLEDSNHVLSQLSALMENCTSCHAIYSITLANE